MSPKRCVLKNKVDGVFRWIMSKNIIFALIYHRHKLLDPESCLSVYRTEMQSCGEDTFYYASVGNRA
jgi:hypothetical protein